MYIMVGKKESLVRKNAWEGLKYFSIICIMYDKKEGKWKERKTSIKHLYQILDSDLNSQIFFIIIIFNF